MNGKFGMPKNSSTDWKWRNIGFFWRGIIVIYNVQPTRPSKAKKAKRKKFWFIIAISFCICNNFQLFRLLLMMWCCWWWWLWCLFDHQHIFSIPSCTPIAIIGRKSVWECVRSLISVAFFFVCEVVLFYFPALIFMGRSRLQSLLFSFVSVLFYCHWGEQSTNERKREIYSL